MPKIFQKNYFLIKFLIFFFIIFFLYPKKTLSTENILIDGNFNISKQTILSLKPTDFSILDTNKINDYQKKIYETGFFKEVNFTISKNQLIIKVIENPLVNFLYVDGVDLSELNKKILKILKVSENNILQDYLLKKDIENISSLLSSQGYLYNSVSYQIIKIPDNKINLFYNIKLNNKFKINRIFFIGDKKFKSSVLQDVVYSSEFGWWKFLSKSSSPSESAINFDISKIKNFYLNNGYYDVQVNSSSLKIINEKEVDLIYSINAGEKYKLSNVYFIDNSNSLKINNINEIKKIYSNLNKSYFNLSLIKRSLKLIDNYLTKSNFDLEIKYELKKVSNNNIELKFDVSDIKSKKILDKIVIKGNSITDEFIIRNNLFIVEGDFVNQSKLKLSIEKLSGINIFSKVDYKIIEINNNSIELVINVEEKPTGEIAAGAGAGTNGVSISGSIRESNFLGKGISLNTSANIGTEKVVGSISYNDPDYKDSGNNLGVSLFVENNTFKNSSYENKLIGTNISSNYEIYDRLYLNPGFGINYDSVKANDDASSLIKSREGNYFTSKIFYNISKNTKNKEFQTTDGYVFGAGQGYSILSDIPYINNRIFGSYYNEYSDGFVGSVKTKIENISSLSNKDIKFSDRLFVTSNNLRGFSNRGIGPKIGDDFIGGNYSYYGDISTTFPNGLPEKWNAITNIFFDTANVWGVDDGSAGSSNKFRSSIGVGLSWVSPLGPIAITYAEPITKTDTDDVEQFNFKIGSAF